ncbi:MAG: DUF3782 domain-containing protein [Candidatus Freyarchaeota archaeon]|nr:DUF3782 domain-containing protein [Candidatus Jordarchaeia archaeon]
MAISRDEFKKVLLDLLKTDNSLREQVYSIITQAPPTKREIETLTREIKNLTDAMTKLSANFEKSLELMVKRMDSFENEMRLLREETAKRMDSFEKSLELMVKRMDSFEKSLELMVKRMDSFEKSMGIFDEEMRKSREEFRIIASALGARWGFAAEESFREAIRGILGSMGFKVEKWEVYDDEGVVFGAPGVVEVDVLVRDKEHMLIEIKSSMSKSDVAALVYKAKLYEKLVGVKPSLSIVSPFVEDDAKERALMEKIKIYTRVREFKPV